MNKYSSANRKRRQTLIVVEGHHEKNELFWLIFRCFPELKIRMDDVWIYGTNIYTLYEDIASPDMYGPDWAENGEDIDLPFVISKKIFPEKVRYKEEFTNIILVFDYERHDPKFSEEKILQMQRYFRDAADMGQLYINYPMIESYQHLQALPDVEYMERKISVSLQPGKKYKELVAKDSVIKDLAWLPHKINDLLLADLNVGDREIRNTCRDAILELSEENDIAVHLQNILTGVISEEHVRTITYRLKDWVIKAGYLQRKESYWKHMRKLLQEIIYHNICKANRIQNNTKIPVDEQFRECFEGLDWMEILKNQNDVSRDVENGFIWVLNTCVIVVADYNLRLVM